MNPATPSRGGAATRPFRPGDASRGQLIDPQSLMAIKNLELRARVVVEGFWTGIHRSPYHGFSVEFTEYRQYSPGDDLRYLDWHLYARTDRHYIKKFEDETNLRCHLLVDNSKSMAYGSLAYTKAQYANTLAATLAYFLYLQGDAVGLLTFDEQIREYLPARKPRWARRRLSNWRGFLSRMRREMKRALNNTGFSLMEMVFTLLVIMVGLGSLYGVMHRGLAQIRTVSAKDYAVVAAASELEYVKAMSRDKIPADYTGPFKGNISLSGLNEGRGILKIRDYKEEGLKEVIATVTWLSAGRRQSVSFSTLVGAP